MSSDAVDEARGVFEAAGLILPPIPAALRPAVRRVREWCYSSRAHLEPGSMYTFDVYLEEIVTGPVEDYVAVGHAGHGVNSYAISYHLVYGPLALFVQVGWGGAYMDNDAQTARIVDWFNTCHEIVGRAESFAADRESGDRLVVVQSDFRAVSACGWLPKPLGNRSRAEARRWLEEHQADHGSALELALASLES